MLKCCERLVPCPAPYNKAQRDVVRPRAPMPEGGRNLTAVHFCDMCDESFSRRELSCPGAWPHGACTRTASHYGRRRRGPHESVVNDIQCETCMCSNVFRTAVRFSHDCRVCSRGVWKMVTRHGNTSRGTLTGCECDDPFFIPLTRRLTLMITMLTTPPCAPHRTRTPGTSLRQSTTYTRPHAIYHHSLDPRRSPPAPPTSGA